MKTLAKLQGDGDRLVVKELHGKPVTFARVNESWRVDEYFTELAQVYGVEYMIDHAFYSSYWRTQ
jgi:hypothetical protein